MKRDFDDGKEGGGVVRGEVGGGVETEAVGAGDERAGAWEVGDSALSVGLCG